MINNNIYLDNAATTKIDPEVLKAMNKTSEYFGNPSSLHSFGQEANKILRQSRESVAQFLNCQPEEIVFTSGGSESDNLAIKGVVDAFYSNFQFSIFNFQSISNDQLSNFQKPHVITTAIEHHAVLHTIQELEKEGKIEATYVKPEKDGVVSADSILKAVRPNTILVSVMYVNNETGAIQPIAEIGKLLSTSNEKRRVFFHCDAVQAAEYLDMNVEELGVDLLTLTAHKFHGPKGVGLLYVKKGTPIRPQILGGSHENGRRAGTENIAAIAGLATAVAEIKNQKSKIKIMESLRDKLENFLLRNIPDTRLNGDKEKRALHISNISFLNAEGEAIILNLDFEGIAVSSGSACTSRSLEPSHVLTAMNVEPKWTHGAIRFSLSRETTEEEIDKVCEVLPPIINKLRKMSPFE